MYNWVIFVLQKGNGRQTLDESLPLFEDPAGRKSRHTLTNCLIDFIFRMPANTEKPVRAVPQSDSASFFYVFFPVFQDREPAPATATGEGFIVIYDHQNAPISF